MSTQFCQMCGKALPGHPSVAFCPGCGADLRTAAPPAAERGPAPRGAPPAPPTAPQPVAQPGWIRDGRDLRRVAQFQRSICWIFLAMLLFPAAACFFGAIPAPILALPVFLIYVALLIFSIVQAVRLSDALGDHVAMQVIGALLMLSPCINLFFLLMISQRATWALRKAGVRVRLMGARDEDVVRILSGRLCIRCGYDLTGNTSGVCPECGTPIGSAAP